MSSDDTETEGVSLLSLIVVRSPILKPFFQQNDKTPFFDGKIFVYKGSKDKENFQNFIPVQIKSTKVDTFDIGETSYPLDISDIRGYYNSRGAILFVVEICGTEHKVFIKSLLPSELKHILAEFEKNNSKSKTVHLKELDISTSSELEHICQEFLLHRKLQYSTIEYSLSITDASEIEIPILLDDTPLEEQIFSKEHLLYGKQANETILRYIETVKLTFISQSLNKSIAVNSKTYFSQYDETVTPDGRFFEFGEKIRIDIPNNKTGGISYQLTGNISARIKVLSFLVDMFEIRNIDIGDGKLALSNIKNQDNFVFVNGIQGSLNYYRDVETLFRFFSIDPDRLNISLLENRDIAYLEFLLDVIIRNKKRETTPIQPGFTPVKIGNIMLGVFIYKKEGDTGYTIIDLFRKLDNLKFRAKKNMENGDEIDCAVSLYVFLKHEFLILVDNLDLAIVLEDIKKVTFSTEYGEATNLFGLELIKAYDVSNRGDFLDAASSIFEWLQQMGHAKLINKINELQIIRRQRAYTPDEKKLLIREQTENHSNNRMICAINILLENKSEAQANFDQLTEDEKGEFIQYPIFTLAKQFNIFENI